MSTLRRPLQTLLLFLITSLTTFGFISSTAEYLIVRITTSRLGEYYQYVGVLLPKDAEQIDVTVGARYLANNEHIAYTDWRRVAIGMLPDGMTNADVDGFSGDNMNEFYEQFIPYYEDYGDVLRHNMTYLNDVVFYGTVQSMDIQTAFNISEGKDEEVEVLTLAVDKILEGRIRWFNKGGTMAYVRVPPPSNMGPLVSSEAPDANPFPGLEVGERYLLRARYDSFFYTLYFDPIQPDGSPTSYFWGGLCLIPLQPEGPTYVPIAEGGVDLDRDAFSKLKADMALLHANLHCMTLISTHDMQAIPERWEGRRRLILAEGRWLTEEDSADRRAVCMIHKDFAKAQGLSLGDVIPLQVWDSCQLTQVNATAGSESIYYSEHPELMVTSFTSSVYAFRYDGYMYAVDFETVVIAPELLELEIVGIYDRRAEGGVLGATAESNEIYIPEFCMPTGFGGDTLMYAHNFLFSFVLRSWRDKEAFINETSEPLTAMGLSVAFLDNNAEAFWGVMEPLMESKLISLCVYSLLLILALILVVFLYLRPRRKEFGVLRALGLPRTKARNAMSLPAALIGAAGIAAGGAFGWFYALRQAAKTLYGIQQEGVEAFVPPSPAWLAGLCGGAFLLLMVFVFAGITMTSRQSVLLLLHGSGAKPQGKNK